MKIAFNTSVIVFTLAMIGCGSGDEARTEPGGPSVAVSYQAGPLADVEVCLHATSTGPVLAKAISASDGRAVCGPAIARTDRVLRFAAIARRRRLDFGFQVCCCREQRLPIETAGR